MEIFSLVNKLPELKDTRMEMLLFSKETDKVMTIVEVTRRERIQVPFHLETHKMST